jgi:hypothetical protein
MAKPRYLTKSRFKLATECPAKLFYTDKRGRYPDTKMDDSFLAALAEGGYQVGELAKLYFPGGTEVKATDHEAALAQTGKLLAQEDAIIYEAAVRHGSLFVRVDVLVKSGRQLKLVEVKAKSFDPGKRSPFLSTRDGTIKSEWSPYLYDVAFQKFVLQAAFPNMDVSAWLMLADKSATSTIDGLNQMFRVVKDASGRQGVSVSPALDAAALSDPILCQVNVDELCDMIYAGRDTKTPPALSFRERVEQYSDHYVRDVKLLPSPAISSACARCEFRATPEEEAQGKVSGFKECWGQALGWQDADFADPNVLEIWNFRKKDALLEQGKVKLDKIEASDIGPKADGKPGLSASERQWLQVQKAAAVDHEAWIDVEGLCAEMGGWTFPLHFIDFETTMVALPFNAGRRPYEAIAFQFSHHVVHADGRVEHKGEYLDDRQGVFPNYDFVRALREEVSGDQGTVFRYATHENTFLNHIYRQLTEDPSDIPDREALLDFIRSITHSSKGSPDAWVGDRDMVDLRDLVKRYYYDPATKGSNSIKKVLPAILASSRYLQEKYADPIYGAPNGIPSRNFSDWCWIQKHEGAVLDPYKLLPPLFQDASEHDVELLTQDDEIREGGAAMTAYARLQFEDMSDYERKEIRKALLQYCELDTLAMVMIYEGWREMIATAAVRPEVNEARAGSHVA